jgi:hypothetical protein
VNARSRRQALLLINEHLGEEVHVAAELDIGFSYTGVLGADGTLTEWRPPEGKTPAMPAQPGDEPPGLYRVGEATVHIPEQGHQSISDSLAGPEIHVRLADNVGLSINWQPFPRPRARTR